jgi:2-polyprenyl-3-methyl-5-hydroxy-6-metoxy-1,4-benzoquinol methylase
VQSTKSPRFNQLKHFFVGKNVLDLGCAVGYRKPDWMHKSIKEVAKSIYGIDLDAKSVAEIQKMGYDVGNYNAQDFELNRKFDLIHAGELIEHLDNFRGFLSCAKNHLAPGGLLLITTPNALRINNAIYSVLGGLRVNAEHTCWFCETTLSALLDRMGFEVVETGYVRHSTYNAFRKVMLKLRSLMLPERVAWNTLYVVAKAKES